MGGVHRVAHQHHMAAPVEMRPLLALDLLEVEPGRAAQVARIGHERRALQVAGKHLFAKRNGLGLVGLVQPVGQPDILGAFHDEGGGVLVKLVNVGLKPAVLGFLEQKREGVIQLVRAQPDVAVRPGHDLGLEDVFVLGANARVDAITGNDQVSIGVLGVGVGVGLKHQLHAQLFAAVLQDVEQLLAPDAHKTVSAGADHLALEAQFDVVPVIEGQLDLGRCHRVLLAHVVHGGIREHHTPAKGVIGFVLLDHGDVVGGVLQLHQQAKVQAGGTAADADNIHGFSREW